MLDEKKIEEISKKVGRSRNWTTIVYPNSAPENWREIIDDVHIIWIESPKHDKDVNPDGTPKKAHWHIILIYDSLKTLKQVWDTVASKVNSPIPQKIESLSGAIRYLPHLDNPEKYQYDEKDIKVHGAFDIDKYLHGNSADKRKVLIEILKYVRDNKIKYFSDIQSYAIDQEKYDWFDVINYSNTMSIKAMIDSIWKKQADEERQREKAEERQRKEESANEEADRIERLLEAKKDRKTAIIEMHNRGISQAEIADTLGIAVRTVRRYLNGK